MWIELQQSLWTHRKTFALAEALAIDEVHAGGLVARLWCWALDNAKADFDRCRGLLSGVVPLAIAGGAGWKGEPSTFFYALIDAGFLEHDGDDIVIHDWWDYSGRLLERRRRDRERKQKARAAIAAKAARKTGTRHKARPQDTPETSDLTSREVNAENVVTVPTLLTESLNSTEVNAPPTPPSNDGGDEARANGSTGLRAVPKPRERERAELEALPLYPALVAAVGAPVGQRARDELRQALDDLDEAGARPGDVTMRAANWPLVMGADPTGRPILLTAPALVKHWARCAEPPRPVDAPDDGYVDWLRDINAQRQERDERDEMAPVAVSNGAPLTGPDPDEIEYMRPERAAPGQYAHPLALAGRRGKDGEVRHELGRRWAYEAAAPGWRRLE